MDNHSRKQLMVFGDIEKGFDCHVEGLMCIVKGGDNFNYCPYCGHELDW